MGKIFNSLFIDKIGFAGIPIMGYVFLALVLVGCLLMAIFPKYRKLFF